ncbi:MAG: lysylphosphatidylglycerol synthase transmembrane domain-containing protein [Pseudomonadota bacterium]
MSPVLSTLIKIAVSLAALWLVFKLGWGLSGLPRAETIVPGWLVLALGVNGLILLLLSARLGLLMTLMPGAEAPGLWWCVRVNWMGLGAAQVAFGTLSGDALRVAALSRAGYGLGESASLIVADRVIGLSALLLLGLGAAALVVDGAWIALPVLLALLALAPWALRLLATMATLRLEKGVGAIRLLAGIAQSPLAWLALPLAVATHALSVAVFYAVGRGFGLMPPLPETAVAVPAGLVGAALPISFGGWGTREVSVAGAYRAMEAPFEAAVLVSVLFGLTTLAFAAPGLIWAWRLLRGRVKAPEA